MLQWIKNDIYPYLDFIVSLFSGDSAEIASRKEFYGSFLKAGDLVFDIGANMGNRMAPLIELGAKAVAVEPQPRCYKFLKLKYGRKADVIKKGVGSKSEILTMHLSKAHVLSTFSTDWMEASRNSSRFMGIKWDQTIEVEMTTLDTLCKTFGIPKFIKIDVEGFEHEVLKGLTKPVDFLSMEYAVPEQQVNLENCLHRLGEIYRGMQFNYSIGERMKWALDEWVSYDEILTIIKSSSFQESRFGDVYVRKTVLA